MAKPHDCTESMTSAAVVAHYDFPIPNYYRKQFVYMRSVVYAAYQSINTVVCNLSTAKVLLQKVNLLENVHLFAVSFGKVFLTMVLFEGRLFASNVMSMTPADADAVCRRVGGGFGGKATRPMPVAAACAVAAQKLGKQVRLSYNRNTDFRQNGGQPAVSFHSINLRFLSLAFIRGVNRQ